MLDEVKRVTRVLGARTVRVAVGVNRAAVETQYRDDDGLVWLPRGWVIPVAAATVEGAWVLSTYDGERVNEGTPAEVVSGDLLDAVVVLLDATAELDAP